MPSKKETNRPAILYSCYANVSREGEQFIPDHTFGFIVSGTSELYAGGKTYVFIQGDYRFLRKNQLSKFVKVPPARGEFKTISVRMDSSILQNIANEFGYKADGLYYGGD